MRAHVAWGPFLAGTILLFSGGIRRCPAAAAWETATPEHMGMNQAKLSEARTYATNAGGSGLITRSGKAVMSWGSQTQTYDLKSTTKSIGVTTLGLAIKDGLMALDGKAQQYLATIGTPPAANEATGWLDDITIRHLATQTAGFDKPGGYGLLLFAPGTMWAYSDGGPNWLADCLTVTYQQDLNTLLFSRVFTPIGITTADLTWRDNGYREDTISGYKRREFGAGISANVNAMARIGYLYLRRGQWGAQQILEASWIDMVRQTVPGVPGLVVGFRQARLQKNLEKLG